MRLGDQNTVVRHIHKLHRTLSETGSQLSPRSSWAAEPGSHLSGFQDRHQVPQTHLTLCLHPHSLDDFFLGPMVWQTLVLLWVKSSSKFLKAFWPNFLESEIPHWFGDSWAVAQGRWEERDFITDCKSLRDLLTRGYFLYHQCLSVWGSCWMVCLGHYETSQSLNPSNMQSVSVKTFS